MCHGMHTCSESSIEAVRGPPSGITRGIHGSLLVNDDGADRSTGSPATEFQTPEHEPRRVIEEWRDWRHLVRSAPRFHGPDGGPPPGGGGRMRGCWGIGLETAGSGPLSTGATPGGRPWAGRQGASLHDRDSR
jgi:hypothetical protein